MAYIILTPNDDTYPVGVSNAGSDTISGLEGNDLIRAGDGDDVVGGNEGNDKLYGQAGDDALHGHDGDDTLDGGADADALYGGAGFDTASYLASATGLVVDVAGLLSTGDAAGDSFSSIERFLMSNHADVFHAGDAGVTAYGYAGADILNGGLGADLLYGHDDDDALNGGAGADKLYGGAGNDALAGGEGADRLYGDAGDDVLDGGAGDDILYASDGADAFIGGEGLDIVSYRSATNGLTIDAGGVLGLDSAAGDTIVGVERVYLSDHDDAFFGSAEALTVYGYLGSDYIEGGLGDDAFYGGDQGDHLAGGGGVDRLDGGEGDDILFGEDGDDLLLGQNGDDVADGGVGADRVYGHAGFDALSGGDGDDKLFGGLDDDDLSGDAGADALFGEAGGDRLDGGGAEAGTYDSLFGGADADTFVFGVGYGLTWVQDFEVGLDALDVQAFVDIASLYSVVQESGRTSVYFDSGDVLRLKNVDAATVAGMIEAAYAAGPTPPPEEPPVEGMKLAPTVFSMGGHVDWMF